MSSSPEDPDRDAERKRRSREFWDRNPCGEAGTWAASRDLRYRTTDPYLPALLAGAPFDGARVLEIGCGQGFDAAAIVGRCRAYVGIDMSLASLEVARRHVPRASSGLPLVAFLESDAERLPFASGSFDLAYSIGVLHHTPSLTAALYEIHRVLRPGGTLILMLYRSLTPLWCVLRVVRGALRVPVVGPRVRRRALAALRRRGAAQGSGTALLELIGCPIIKTFTLTGLRRRFRDRFEIDRVDRHRVGLDQVLRLFSSRHVPRWPQVVLHGIDRALRRWLGFYLVVQATRLP